MVKETSLDQEDPGIGESLDQAIISRISGAGGALSGILAGGKVTLQRLLDLLRELIEAVEFFTGEKWQGVQKHEVVKSIYRGLDEKFNLTYQLDLFVGAKFGRVYRLIPRSWRRRLLEGVIDLLIHGIVSVLNSLIWKNKGKVEEHQTAPASQ